MGLRQTVVVLGQWSHFEISELGDGRVDLLLLGRLLRFSRLTHQARPVTGDP